MGQQGYAFAVTERRVSNIIYISEIPKVINGKRLKNFNPNMSHYKRFKNSEIGSSETQDTKEYLHKVDDLSAYSTELIDIDEKIVSKTLCNRGFCCQFDLNIDFDKIVLKEDTSYYRFLSHNLLI